MDPEVRLRLPHYYAVLTGEKPARYRVARRMRAELKGDLDALWEEHRRLAQEMKGLMELGLKEVEGREPVKPSYMDLKAKIARETLHSCTFCEWKCRLDRYARRGFCRLDHRTRVSSFFHHFGEEPPLVGRTGSGTIFFTGCNFRCAFCQNYDISQDAYNGMEADTETLAAIMKMLSKERCLNVNLVGGEPTPNLHTILSALAMIDENVPILWNSNMYMSEGTMELISDIVDIWLPDFKYGNDECALRLSAIRNYFSIVTRNLKWARESGDMIIRHLVMPNHIECCTKPVLKWIAENLPPTLVNIMGQYRPEYRVARLPERYPDIARRPSWQEMEEAFSYASQLGIPYAPVS